MAGQDDGNSNESPGVNGDGHAHSPHDRPPPPMLTDAVQRARSGLRSDVAELTELLAAGVVYIPLAEDMPDAPEGEEMEIGEELSFRPHMLLHEDQTAFAVAYTEPELVDPMQRALDWDTSGEDLKFIQVPAVVALDLAQSRAEDHEIAGVVFNPGTESELVLQRDEAASLAQGTALPLVGYVTELPEGREEETQVLEHADPPPPALVDALKAAEASSDEVTSIELRTTFNPERDREPHMTLVFHLSRVGIDRARLADEVMDGIVPHLPPPGYVDIVFKDPPN